MYSLQIQKDPLDAGFEIHSVDHLDFNPGVTILVGCNGWGKSTTLQEIKRNLDDNGIGYIEYDDLTQGRSNFKSRFLSQSNFEMLATSAMSSEGENIKLNLSIVAGEIRTYLQTGESSMSKLCNIFKELGSDEDIEAPEPSNKRFLIFDGIDSGVSIDGVGEIKELFDYILKDSENLGLETYIIASCNEFELAYDMPCLNINTGAYMKFVEYAEFKQFILDTANQKEERYNN